MMHRQKGGASFRIDRTFTGVGRIALSSGTTHGATFKRINAMLTALYTIGKIDTLAEIRDKVHAPLVVLHFYERGQLDKLPSRETVVGLMPSLWAFQARHECGPSYRADLGTSIRHMAKQATKASTVADVPKLVRELKALMIARPVAFNRLRTHMMAFAGDVQGEMSPLWIDIKRVKRFRKAEGQRPKKLQRRPLTMVELDRVCAAFQNYPVMAGKRGSTQKVVRYVIPAADLAAMARTMALTGMRPKEYWSREENWWQDRGFHVWVNGTKTPAAKRPTFRLLMPIRPVCGEQFFRKRFAEATTKALREGLDAYSLRRTFAKLGEDARIVESRREAYMGHGPQTITDLYLQTNVLPFIAEDAAAATAWIASEREKSITGPIVQLMDR